MKQLLQQLALTSPMLLKVYRRDGLLQLTEMKTRVFVRARQLLPHLADYRFKNYESLAFRKQNTEQTVLDCLCQLADTYLEFWDAEIRCKFSHYEAWQQCLTRVPPLPIMAAALFQLDTDPAKKGTLFEANFLQHSFLPSIYHPLLENLIREEGLNELHIHMNGTTEFDLFWQDALAFPGKIYRDLRAVFKMEQREVFELYAQIDADITAVDVRNFLDAARTIRDWLVRRLALNEPYPEDLSLRTLGHFGEHPPLLQNGRRHPLAVVNGRFADLPATACEALMLLQVFERVAAGDRATARLLHQYLLLQGYFNRLLVQQLDQVGFDQFQKITLNEIREFSEQQYLSRFRQLKGRYGNDLAFLEGRFAPKLKGSKTSALIRRIYRDYQRFLAEEGLPTTAAQAFGSMAGPSHSPFNSALAVGAAQMGRVGWRTPHGTALAQDSLWPTGERLSGTAPPPFVLKLTAHLIKKKAREAKRRYDGVFNLDTYGSCRHATLRRELNVTTRRLANVVRHCAEGRALVAGLDAAANELHAPPEVFAACFRLFRRRGFMDFTYHAGEDFVHLISGMRVIWEAADFLDLRVGNRIGHATAIGIDPGLWRERVGEAVLPITRMEWLDNLVFAAALLQKKQEFAVGLQRIHAEIRVQFNKIYPVDQAPMPSVELLFEAWQMRELDALLLDDQEVDVERPHFYRLYLDQDRRYEGERIWRKREEGPRAFQLWRQYHQSEVVERGGALIEVPVDFFSVAEHSALQGLVIDHLNDRSIALESMPTSNVVISYYKSYREHHLFRWLGIAKENNDLPEPMVVLASDDPGIFANNLRADFSHLFRVMIGDLGLSPRQAVAHLSKLNHNGRIFRFGQRRALPAASKHACLEGIFS